MSGATVTAVEFDRDVIGYLKQLLRKHPKAQVLNQDFLSLDPRDVGVGPHKLIGNLPYNITSPVLDWATTHRETIKLAVFMVQKEVGLRVAASPGSKDWSPLSIFTQLAYRVRLCFDVPPKHFQPPPKVTSCVIELTPAPMLTIPHRKLFESIVRLAFRQRRKLLSNNLAPEIFPDTNTARMVLKRAGLPENCRAEQISIAGFLDLTEHIATI